MNDKFVICVCCVFVVAVSVGFALLLTLYAMHHPPEGTPAARRQPEENLTVATSLGQVRGVSLRVLETDVVAFYGVPYAEPPVGTRRFRVPKRHAAWAATLDATRREDVRCPQVATDDYFRPPTNSSDDEDCLRVDVFVPRSPYDRSSTRAMVVVLHGGSFGTGSNRDPLYDGSWLAAGADVVVAVPNYRLGPLGFLRAEEKNAPGNQGLWDQLLALQFLRDNAAAFGARQGHVTLLGVDSGAVSVGLHLLSPLSRQFFSRAFLLGGSPFVMSRFSAYAEQDEVEQLGTVMCAGPPTADGEDTWDATTPKPPPTALMSCLRQAPAGRIVANLEEFNGVHARPFGPLYGSNDTEDDFFLSTATGDLLLPDEEGTPATFAGKTLVLGYATNEGEYFLRQFFGQWQLEKAETLPRPLVRLLLERLVLHFFAAEEVATVSQLYFADILAADGSSFSAAEAYASAAEFLGDVLVKCPTRLMADVIARGGGSVYFYEFDFNINALTLREDAELRGQWRGAPHYADALFSLGAVVNQPPEDEAGARATSLRMMGKVGAFARTGVPDRTRDIPWPLYRTHGDAPRRQMAIITLNRLRISQLRNGNRCRHLGKLSRWKKLLRAADME
ncbi:cholinesterase-like [Haemaphysalis longicornis]